MRRLLYMAAGFLLVLQALPARADCAPASDLVGPHTRTSWVQGGLVYDLTDDVLKTCDGTNWNMVGGGGFPACAVNGSTLQWQSGAWACKPPVFASCKGTLDAGASTGNGLYTIDPDGAGGPIEPFDVYCDMTTDGGGWTLAKSGHGGGGSPQWNNTAGYEIVKSATLAANNYALPDARINQLKTAAYRVDGTCDNWTSTTVAYASPSCVYGSVANVDNSSACRRWYANAALSTTLGTLENFNIQSVYYGIRDTHSNFTGSYITTQTNNNLWFLGHSGPTGFCDAAPAGSRLRVWVR